MFRDSGCELRVTSYELHVLGSPFQTPGYALESAAFFGV
jgi:hypothetical protein